MTFNQKNIDWARSHIVGFPEVKLVLVVLAMDSDEQGRGVTTLADLSRHTDLEEKQLPPILHTLENFGLAVASVSADGTISYRLMLNKPGARKL